MVEDNGFVFLNGRYVPAARATVSVYDRGLLYGDGLFETMRGYGGKVFALPAHLRRLQRSADVLGIPLPKVNWEEAIAGLLAKNRLTRCDAWVRLTVTRGSQPPRVLPAETLRPTYFVLVRQVDPELAVKQRHGVAVKLLPYSRYGFVPELKSLNYLPAVIGKVLAAQHGAEEGIFVRAGRYVTEGTTSSLFVVRDHMLCTPPVRGILPGITRGIVGDIAVGAKLKVVERQISPADLRASDEAFLTSSLIEILPVVKVNDARIGSGKPGTVTRKLQRMYRNKVSRG
jgi:branched-chain amino acid aminotransferase